MRTLLTVAYLFSLASAACYDPSSAFPVPLWQKNAHALEPAFRVIETALDALGSDDKYNSTSFSVEVTSQSETLWTYHHSAREHNKTRPGVTHVNGDSQYRIASITKTFTVLGVLYQHAAGNLSLDDPVDQYIAELSGPESGVLPWKDITLRSLASQLSGIPREMDQADLLNEVPDPTKLGLPPVDRKGVPDCYEYNEYEKPCNRTQLLKYFLQKQPLFAPNQQSTYSNVAYELLGLVLENVTGLPYEEYMEQAIFKPLNLSSTTLSKPSDSHAVLPLGQYFWDVAQGVHSPTGGIYSSSSDMSAYCRYVLTHYNALATGVNWFLPASWGTNLQNFYGMPWEIFRTDKMLDNTKRPVTLVTKAGGVPSYFSRMSLLPEYGLGIAILVGGDNRVLAELQEAVTLSLVRAAEAAVWKDVESIYTGSYTAVEPSGLNSSATFGSDSLLGLTLETFISNSTDVFETLLPTFAGVRRGQPWHAQLVPTLLYKNQTTQQGEIWRLLIVPERTSKDEVLDDWCNTDIDVANYAGLPINEVVFWHEENEVELPAWRVRMRRSEQPTLDDKAKFAVQQG